MPSWLLFLADAVAIGILVLGLFWRRHGRRELVVAYLTVNVGVLAVTAALASSSVGAGLGLGLFGLLSIIRLRSEELSQREVAYYFAALTIGLLAGVDALSPGFTMAAMAAVVLAVAVGDHPRIVPSLTTQELVLDRALTGEDEIRAEAARVLGAEVVTLSIRRVDLVDDTTLVKVGHRPLTEARRHEAIR